MINFLKRIFHYQTYWYYVATNGLNTVSGIFSSYEKYFPIGTADEKIIWNTNRKENEPKYMINFVIRVGKNEFWKFYNYCKDSKANKE